VRERSDRRKTACPTVLRKVSGEIKEDREKETDIGDSIQVWGRTEVGEWKKGKILRERERIGSAEART